MVVCRGCDRAGWRLGSCLCCGVGATSRPTLRTDAGTRRVAHSQTVLDPAHGNRPEVHAARMASSYSPGSAACLPQLDSEEVEGHWAHVHGTVWETYEQVDPGQPD